MDFPASPYVMKKMMEEQELNGAGPDEDEETYKANLTSGLSDVRLTRSEILPLTMRGPIFSLSLACMNNSIFFLFNHIEKIKFCQNFITTWSTASNTVYYGNFSKICFPLTWKPMSYVFYELSLSLQFFFFPVIK